MAIVTVTDLAVHEDDRGLLSELLRTDSQDFAGFGQVYVVHNRTAGTIRAYHRHNVMWDWFIIVKGAAKFRFYDDSGNTQTVISSDHKLRRIAVPPGVWHGWMSLEDDTILLSVASEPYLGYNREGELDEERVDWRTLEPEDQMGGWGVEFK